MERTLSNLTQVSPGSVERPDVALKEDLDAIAKVASDASAQAKETADFLETRVPEGRTINDRPLNEDIHLSAEDLDTYTRQTIDDKINAVASSGYNPVHVNGKLLDRDIILAAGDVGAYSAEEVDTKFDGLIPASRTVNGHALTDDVTLVAGDVDAYTKSETDSLFTGLVPATRTINGVPLDADVTLLPADLGVLAEADAVPRTFTINGEPMTGDGIQIAGGDGYSRTEVDEKLNQYLPVQNNFGLGITPQVITAGKLAESAQGSGFFAYAEGDDLDADGNPIKTNMEDRPAGSTSGKIMVMATGGDTNVVSALAFPDDVNGVFFRKGAGKWEAVGGASGSLPLPNVHAMLNDSLILTAGSAPYDTLVIGSDTLDLNTKSVTFVRPSVATYVDNAGVLQAAETDEARFERPGLLIEGPATNAVVPSNDSTYWTTSGSTASPNQTGPDGLVGLGAVKFQVLDGTKTVPVNLQLSAANTILTAGSSVTFSVFAKAGEQSVIQLAVATEVSANYGNFDLVNMTTGGTASNLTMTRMANGWVRCSMTLNGVAVPTSGTYFNVYLSIVGSLAATRLAAVNAPTGNGLYAFGPQIEAGSMLTSYIPTSTTPVTRAADMVTLRGAQNWNAGPFTVAAEVHLNWSTPPNDAPRIFDLGDTGNGGRDYVSLAAYNGTKQVSGLIGDGTAGATIYRASKDYTGQSFVAALRYDGTGVDTTVNGSISDKTAVPYVIGNTAATLRIGGQATVGTRHLYGHIRNFRVWHRALKDQEVKGIQ